MPTGQVEVLRAACCVAGLDREVCEKERPLLERLAEAAGVGRASLSAMIDRARSDQNFFTEQFRMLRNCPDEAFKVVLSVAIVDGALSENERVVLHHFAQKLGLTDERFDQLMAAADKRVASNAAGGTSPKPDQR